MRTSHWIKLLSFVATLALGVALFIWFLDQHGTAETFSTLNQFGLFAFFGFVLISLGNFALLSWRWYLAVNQHDLEKHISFWSIIRHRMSGYAASYLTPAAQVGGEPLRIALLHKDDVPLSKATSSVILDVVFEITGFAIYIALGLVISLFQNVLPTQVEWVVGVVLLVVIGLLASFFVSVTSRWGLFSSVFCLIIPKRLRWHNTIKEKILRTEHLMRDVIKRHPRLTLWMLALSLVTVAFRGVEIAFLAHFLGHPVGVVEAILLSSLPGIVLLVPIPSALGILEGSTAGIVTLLGLTLNPIALVLLIRFRDMIFILLGLVHIGHSIQEWLSRRIVQPVSSVIHRV